MILMLRQGQADKQAHAESWRLIIDRSHISLLFSYDYVCVLRLRLKSFAFRTFIVLCNLFNFPRFYVHPRFLLIICFPLSLSLSVFSALPSLAIPSFCRPTRISFDWSRIFFSLENLNISRGFASYDQWAPFTQRSRPISARHVGQAPPSPRPSSSPSSPPSRLR